MDVRTAHERGDELFWLDVREPHEVAAGRAPGIHHIPMGDLGARQAELPRDRTILCVCRSGARSGTVCDALVRAGYEAENLEGGMLAWREAELPMEADGEADPVVQR